MVAAYLLISPLAFDGIRAYSDASAHVPKAARAAGHPFWHPMYLGLGFLPNPWGIAWNDTIAADAVARVDPTAAYLSPRYESILRHLYFQIVWHDPGYVARVYALKAAITIHEAARRFWPALLAPFALVAGSRRRRFRRELLLVAPAAVLALLPPVLTEPTLYDDGFVGVTELVAVLAGAGIVLLVRDLTVANSGPRRPRPGRRSRGGGPPWSGSLARSPCSESGSPQPRPQGRLRTTCSSSSARASSQCLPRSAR